jgi:(2Fe-2S) ferredoxin
VKISAVKRRVQLFVCTNARRADDPLGGGCGSRGEAVHRALQEAIARRRAWQNVWLAKASCLGVCPKQGCTIAVTPSGALLDEVEVDDADAVLDTLLGPMGS